MVRYLTRRLAVAVAAAVHCVAACGLPAAEPFSCDTTKAAGPLIMPWRAFEPDPAFHGQWLVAGDLDGDGVAEIVTARHENQSVSALGAWKLDGSALWKHGTPGAGIQGLWCDVPVQIYDLDGDGKNELYLSRKGFLVVLEGATGKELQRWPLPAGLEVADCIVFANLRGLPQARDILVKDRYHHIWAYTDRWQPLWDWAPQRFMTCHHPTCADVDRDGRDEVMAGYSLLDDDGRELWPVKSAKVNLGRGHLDCSEVMAAGQRPADFRLLLTYCGDEGLALLDGTGRTLWELTGRHFESVDAGKIRAEISGQQVVVDIDHRPFGQGLVWLLDDRGTLLGEYTCGYGRHHRLLDFNGDGLAEILIGNTAKLFDGRGRCVAHFGPADAFGAESLPQPQNDPGPCAAVGDLDGDRRPEVILHTTKRVHIYQCPQAAPAAAGPVGTGANFTLY